MCSLKKSVIKKKEAQHMADMSPQVPTGCVLYKKSVKRKKKRRRGAATGR
jgi:hypothetical protein